MYKNICLMLAWSHATSRGRSNEFVSCFEIFPKPRLRVGVLTCFLVCCASRGCLTGPPDLVQPAAGAAVARCAARLPACLALKIMKIDENQ